MTIQLHCIYKTDTGQIVSSGGCPVEEVPLWCQQGESWILVDQPCSSNTHWVVDGKLTALPVKPSPHHIFNYSTGAWEPDVDAAWYAVRAERNRLLQQSDWTQLPDVPIATKEAWAVYRQTLRDVTEQADPFAIVWPVAPSN